MIINLFPKATGLYRKKIIIWGSEKMTPTLGGKKID